MDTGLIFIATLFALEYYRTIVYLGWNWEVLLHKLSSGSIWLFALFMITDPMTIPTNRLVRIVWTMAVAFTSFYLTNYYFVTRRAAVGLGLLHSAYSPFEQGFS